MSRPDDQLIAWLGIAGDGEPWSAAVVGGKAASLDRLGNLGFRVPPGFCLTTAAFRTQMAMAGPLPDDGPEQLARAIEDLPLAPTLREALGVAVDRLAGLLGASGFEPRFAVRSSAVAEDGTATSYAGLHETELDVPPHEIEGAVRRCWASLWSPAAVAYRRRRELSAADAAMAVVVQALVPADASAVVFTRHPVTGREDQIVLTSTRGLGDEMVAGTITPDTTVVDKASRRVLEFDAGDGSAAADGPALSPVVLDALVELSLAVEAKLEVAVDIEAAYAGGSWYLLQARPITTGASTDEPVYA